MGRRLKIFTWNVDGRYLYYLSQVNIDIYVPLDLGRGDGYIGRSSIPFGRNVIEVEPGDVRTLEFDCIIFQSPKNYLIDQHILFSPDQHSIPKLYLEHQPPRISPASTSHIVDDPDMILVHVCDFNKLMWDNNHTPAYVIRPGVSNHNVRYTGELDRGIVILSQPLRERDAGVDVLREVSKRIPLDVIGSSSLDSVETIGEVPVDEIPEFISRYRFYFDPSRYGSPTHFLCDAMMTGLPVIGTPTGEMPAIITNEVSGYLSADVDALISVMKKMLEDPLYAHHLSQGARSTAIVLFDMKRFIGDWEILLQKATSRNYPPKYFSEILKNLS